MPWGIGDAISVGLSAVDQVRRNDPAREVEVDVLCNQLQTEVLAVDPRIHRLIEVDRRLFPSNEAGTVKRGFFLSSEAVKLVQFLRTQGYAAVLPFVFSPTFFYELHLPIMFLSPGEVWQMIARVRAFEDTPTRRLMRGIISKHFGKSISDSEGDADIPLYIYPEHVVQARRALARLKRQASVPPELSRVLLVAPDTSSEITRPPVALLAEGIAGALKRDSSLVAAILPGYTDVHAAPNLWQALSPAFPGRVLLLPAEPKFPLLELAAFIDQCDIFISGDTAVMHLAAARKVVRGEGCAPRNTVKIITLFGGTNPALYGYSQRTIILGRGRKEQAKIVPGIVKDLYDPKGKNLFDHISPQQLTDVIVDPIFYAKRIA
jgi:ADP-heptose:LPS heptosyltransferase